MANCVTFCNKHLTFSAKRITYNFLKFTHLLAKISQIASKLHTIKILMQFLIQTTHTLCLIFVNWQNRIHTLKNGLYYHARDRANEEEGIA